MYKQFFMYIRIKFGVWLREGYLHSGIELIPLFPYLRAGLKRGGGGDVLTYKNLIYLLNLQILKTPQISQY